jgi:hypothetical protein
MSVGKQGITGKSSETLKKKLEAIDRRNAGLNLSGINLEIFKEGDFLEAVMLGELRGVLDRVTHSANLKIIGLLDNVALVYLLGRLQYCLENGQSFLNMERDFNAPPFSSKSTSRSENKKMSKKIEYPSMPSRRKVTDKPPISRPYRKRKNRLS